MKQYVFSFSTHSLDFNSREYKIEAPGMMDALMKVKHIKANVEAEISSTVHIHFKGIAYSE
ncbi:hypothetical protein [Bacillus taeanensis]|uniref:Uncharacterized protein n=1 Tax=Bacillus taeanensis TaxID=273032 RepID=A0A366XZS6_9BACI|nr:hypothetical protein [Bacillus taeanensis]RBW69653.1 hypothetical protein DS031_10540 [Bacillus taeanensis]